MIGMYNGGNSDYAVNTESATSQNMFQLPQQSRMTKKLKTSASFDSNGSSPILVKSNNKPTKRKNAAGNVDELRGPLNSKIATNGTNSSQPPASNRVVLSFAKRVDFANQLLAATNRPPQTNLVLNSFQLINFIEFYFNDLSSGASVCCSDNSFVADTPMAHHTLINGAASSHQQQQSAPSNMITNCFPCSACSTKFTFEQTFQMHLNRRSVLIRLYCLKCATYKTFFNKCKLFYHIYSHKLNLFEGMYTGLSIDVIPGEKSKEKASVDLSLLFQSINKMMAATNEHDETDINGVEHQAMSNGTAAAAAVATLTGRFKMNQSDLFEVRRFVKTLLGNRLVVYKCSICSALFFTNEDLRQHYQQTLNYELNLMQLQQQQHQSQQKLIINGHVTNNPQSSGGIKKIGTALIYRNQIRILKQKVALKNTAMIKSFSNLLDMDLGQSPANQYFYELLNKISSKKLQFSTRCFQLAALNFINNFKMNSLCLQDDILDYVSTSIVLSKLGPMSTSSSSSMQSGSDSSCNIQHDPSIPPMPKITNGHAAKFPPTKKSPTKRGNLASTAEQHQQHLNSTTTPLICPLCGLTFDPLTQIIPFKLHLLYVCNITQVFDLSLYKCPFKQCLFMSETASEFATHWLNKHVVRHHECLICEQQLGIKFTFEEESIDLSAKASVNGAGGGSGPNSAQLQQQSYANSIPMSILNNQEESESGVMDNGRSPIGTSQNLGVSLIDTPPPAISARLLAEINRHFFEHHRNTAVRLKVVYRCQCVELASDQCDHEFDKDSFIVDKDSSGGESSCTFNDWRLCKKHVLFFVNNKYGSFIKCLFCKKNVLTESFQMHLTQAHPAEKDSFFVCPICGFIKKNNSHNSSLHAHVMSEHPNTSLSKNPASCVYNLKTSMLETTSSFDYNNGGILPVPSGVTTSPRKSQAAAAAKRFSLTSSEQSVKADFDIYFCVSCRHFYPNDTSFSHSCWNDLETEANGGNHAAANNGGPTTNGGNSNQPAAPATTNNNNYFSPIYLKLNLNKLLVPVSNSSGTHETRPPLMVSSSTPTGTQSHQAYESGEIVSQ